MHHLMNYGRELMPIFWDKILKQFWNFSIQTLFAFWFDQEFLKLIRIK